MKAVDICVWKMLPSIKKMRILYVLRYLEMKK